MNTKQREIISYWYEQLGYNSGQVEDAFQFMKDMIKQLRGTDSRLDDMLTEIDNENE